MRKAKLQLNQLFINPENYRFDQVSSQGEAINVMVNSQKKKLVVLATDIAEHGLDPTALLNVMEIAKDQFVLNDGNRRITALKLIENPSLIEDLSLKKEFTDLHNKYLKQIPKEINCVIFTQEEKEQADRLVYLTHTGENGGIGLVTWDSTQKGRFVAKHKKTELRKSLQIMNLLEEENINTEGIDSTNLDRLLSTPEVRQEIGIDFKESKLMFEKDKSEVLKNLSKIVEAMKNSDFKVSEIYTAEDRRKWITKLLHTAEAVLQEVAPTETPTIPNNTSRLEEHSKIQYKDVPVDLPNLSKRPIKYSDKDAEKIVEFILYRFPLVASYMKYRPQKREPLLVNDEYDVQYLLAGLLKLFFDDLRPEDPTLSDGVSSGRLDFFVVNGNIGIEAKMTRKGLADKDLYKQITLDIPTYKSGKAACRKLYFFIFDREKEIRNIPALVSAIEKQSRKNPVVKVIVVH
ncbi:MAG TPA: hypothetical protein VLB73_02810 [Patescibacteria group bacterium]|nr:hypothetical protein [Patescibacteria group bacterium]